MINRFRDAAAGQRLLKHAALTAALGTVLLAPAAASAQDVDARWLPWIGCWEESARPVSAESEVALICFRPSEEGGVEAVSLEGAEVLDSQWLHANGVAYDTPLEGCEGWERLTFSASAGRMFLESEHVCEGDIERRASGVISMVSHDEWIDARVLAVGDEKSVWVTRYRSASTEDVVAAGFGEVAEGRTAAIDVARSAGAARPSVHEVVEATNRVDPQAVSAWIVERDARLAVDADRLVQLADAGVPGEVIDVIVAVSFPEHFDVERAAASAGSYAGGAWVGATYPAFYDPFFFSARYGYGYPGYGYGYGGYYRRPIVIVVGPSSPESRGRVINRQGYTSGRSAGTTQSRTPTRAATGGRSSGSSGSATRSSGSSSGRSTGRTARRRGGSGGL